MKRQLSILFFIILAIAATVLLSTSLTGVTLLPGKPLPLSMEEIQVPQEGAAVPGGEAAFNLFRIVYFLVWLLLPILLVYLIISPRARKALLKQVVKILPFILLLVLAGKFIQNMAGNQEQQGVGGFGAPELGMAYPAPSESFVPSSPSWAVWGVSLALAVVIVLLFVLVLWLFWRGRKKESGIVRLAEEAQNALDALESGANLRNVVLRCYYEMSQVISETRGIKREVDLTPQEFQLRLEEKGLPKEPVRSLTALFEEVRYGLKTPGTLEEQRAVASLTAIVEFCKG